MLVYRLCNAETWQWHSTARRVAKGLQSRQAGLRTFIATSWALVPRHELSISEGAPEDQVIKEAAQLVEEGRWRLCNNGAGLERQFKFKTFAATLSFMNDVAAECKEQKHHPEWTNVFNRTHVRWTTHNPKGLSDKDTHMARFCDEVAAARKEQWPDPDGVSVGGGKVKGAGACCGQK